MNFDKRVEKSEMDTFKASWTETIIYSDQGH